MFESLPLPIRRALLLLWLWVWWGWRRKVAGRKVPESVQADHRAPLPPIDTGGVYRPPFGSQFGDPSESHSSPHSEGSNCTMAAAGMALRYHQGESASNRRGGDMRHHQSDNESGTDLYDAAQAWAHYGESLSIRSGQGWGEVADCHDEGRGIILQGTGGIATGCGDYTGGHAVYVAPEDSGSKWLLGDPECSGWDWVEESNLKAFAQRLSSGCYFAVTKARSSTPPPPPDEPDCPDCPPPPKQTPPGPELNRAYQLGGQMALDASVGEWVGWVGAEPGTSWDQGQWEPAAARDLVDVDDDCAGVGFKWGRGPLPDPVQAARHALTAGDPVYDGAGQWSGSLWP